MLCVKTLLRAPRTQQKVSTKVARRHNSRVRYCNRLCYPLNPS